MNVLKGVEVEDAATRILRRRGRSIRYIAGLWRPRQFPESGPISEEARCCRSVFRTHRRHRSVDTAKNARVRFAGITPLAEGRPGVAHRIPLNEARIRTARPSGAGAKSAAQPASPEGVRFKQSNRAPICIFGRVGRRRVGKSRQTRLSAPSNTLAIGLTRDMRQVGFASWAVPLQVGDLTDVPETPLYRNLARLPFDLRGVQLLRRPNSRPLARRGQPTRRAFSKRQYYRRANGRDDIIRPRK